jgi:hypothetical protein
VEDTVQRVTPLVNLVDQVVVLVGIMIIQELMVMQVVLVHQKEIQVVMEAQTQVVAEVVQVQLDLMVVDVMAAMVVMALLHV